MVGKKVYFTNRYLPYLLVLPEVLLVVRFFLLPASQALVQALFREDAFGLSRTFVGLDNFHRILRDPLYSRSVATSFIIAFSVTLFTMAAGLFLASQILHINKKRALVYQTFLIIPYAIAPLVSGVLWFFLFSPAVGIISYGLRSFSIIWNHSIVAWQAVVLVMLAASWQRLAYTFLFYVAGMKSIPESLVESAAVDGASAQKRFIHIIFPLLSPTTFFLLTMNLIYAFFETFPVIHQLTQGGPNNATSSMVYKIYQDGFRGLDFGGSAAQSVILMAIVIILVSLQFRFIERKVVY